MIARKIKIGHMYRFKGAPTRFVFIGFNVMDLFNPLYEFEVVGKNIKIYLKNVKRIEECL